MEHGDETIVCVCVGVCVCANNVVGSPLIIGLIKI